MAEFIHRIPRGEIRGAASDPDQRISNAGTPLQEKSLSSRNAVGIAIAANSARKIISTGYNVVVDQLGDNQLERDLAIAGKAAGYVGVAFATGNPYLVAGAIVVDSATSFIRQSVKNSEIRFTNEVKQQTRGQDTSIGGYYG